MTDNRRYLVSRNQREGWYARRYEGAIRSHIALYQLKNYVKWLKRFNHE